MRRLARERFGFGSSLDDPCGWAPGASPPWVSIAGLIAWVTSSSPDETDASSGFSEGLAIGGSYRSAPVVEGLPIRAEAVQARAFCAKRPTMRTTKGLAGEPSPTDPAVALLGT